MSPIEIFDLALRVALVTLAAASLITVHRGIRAMQRSATQRAAEHDRRHAAAQRAADQRHAEATRAADQRHAEATRAADQRDADSRRRHAETMAAFDVQRQALETLIARTAPPAPAE